MLINKARLDNERAIEWAIRFIRSTIDENATISRRSGATLIHYTVCNGKEHVTTSGHKTDFRLVRTMNAEQALEFCSDMGWADSAKG